LKSALTERATRRSPKPGTLLSLQGRAEFGSQSIRLKAIQA
jgi:hypothetical protein